MQELSIQPELIHKKPLVEQYLKKSFYELSAFSFVSIYSWKDFFDFEWREIDGNLCIFARDSIGCFLYLPPIGEKVSSSAIHACFEMMDNENKNSKISRIENVEERQLSYFPSKEFSFYKKADEYVYRREDIAHLKGNALKSKRSSYNYFIKNYSHEFLSYEDAMQKECEMLFEEWASERAQIHTDPIYRQMLEENTTVHRVTLKCCKELGLIGRVVQVDGKIRAYSFGVPLNTETFCILFEVVDLKTKGLSVFIFREFCADLQLQQFRYINVMDDFGLKNIKTTKLSFRPCKILPSYVVSRKS